jgi:hypothetical protein
MKTQEQLLQDIKTLRDALKIVSEEASRPADQAASRIKLCGRIADVTLQQTRGYDDPKES